MILVVLQGTVIIPTPSYFSQFKKIGFETCAEFCEHMIKVEHTAMLPASSLLLPDDDFSVRLSYADYDGVALTARLELPADRKPLNFALFAHCFTCNKNLSAIRWVEKVNVHIEAFRDKN